MHLRSARTIEQRLAQALQPGFPISTSFSFLGVAMEEFRVDESDVWIRPA
jgi:hypothetical protein